MIFQRNDSKTAYTPGQSDTYAMVVFNFEPSNVTGASVTDNFPSEQAFSMISG